MRAQLGTATVETIGSSADRAERAVRRYLDLLRDALLDEHYLENELRIEHLLECVGTGEDVDYSRLANPARYMATVLRQRQEERRTGQLPSEDANAGWSADGFAYAGLGRFRLTHIEACLEQIREEGVEGDFVDSGTGRGGAAIFMCGFLEVHEMADRRVWVADRFESRGPMANFEFAHNFNSVRDGFARFGLLEDRVVFLQGPPSQTLAEAAVDGIALLRVASEDPEEVGGILGTLYDRVTPGGFVVVDGYGAPACEAAVEEFRSARGVAEPLERVDWSAAAWRKPGLSERDARASTRRRSQAARRALKAAATKDLSVVVAAFNMRRAARRTLHSLSRSYQWGIDDLDYEVIVVENGSDPEQRLGEDLIRSFGTEFRYIDVGENASPSPAGAINRGIAASTARNLALMIDGAHLLTPGVLHYAMEGLSTYEPAAVIAKHWYVGPGQQPATVAGGYDEELEDLLFAEIDWPTDGYRLFEIGQFIGSRDWFDGDWESNCLFVPRSLVEQAGGMDESFSSPGGGFVNLDFYDRMVCSPGVNVVSMLGEATFHQVHGGTTTNVTEPSKLVDSYRNEYAELRGRRFHVPLQRAHYVGKLPRAALRIRPRRMNSLQRFKDAYQKGTANRPFRPAPVPRRSEGCVHRGLLAKRRVASNELARQADAQGANRSFRLPRAHLPAEAGLDRGDSYWRGRPGAVPGLDLRPDRQRSGAVDRLLSAHGPSAPPADHLPARRSCRRQHGCAGEGDRRRAAAEPGHPGRRRRPPGNRRLSQLRLARAGRVLPCGRGHHPGGKPGVAAVRSRPGGRHRADHRCR